MGIIYEKVKQKNVQGSLLDYLFIVKVIIDVGELLHRSNVWPSSGKL